ncbi:hypothetical protein PVK06_032191 [Gossypium arboreum]|uniref:Uncharacterized protein n=1 Tax=Gossypium arboreum TaxID=29729 RepID=A0ABR0NTF4_GOSAR|nr:hypothetical protein PVK06_032191 [Gossypium arboreum]
MSLFALIRSLLIATPWELFFTIVESTYVELTFEFFSTFFLPTVLSLGDNPRAISFRLGGIAQHFSNAGFGVTLNLYSNNFLAVTELSSFPQHIHYSVSLCWSKISEVAISCNPSQSKAQYLPPTL